MDRSELHEFGDALSAGIACLNTITGAEAADPSWPATLEGLERAMLVIHRGEVASNLAVYDEHLSALRRLRVWVDEWIASGVRHEGAVAFAGELHRSLTGSPAGFLEHSAKFTPANGGSPRAVTLRISNPTQGPKSWSARVEILGFSQPRAIEVCGETWAQAVEAAAASLPPELSRIVSAAGGGTVDPAIVSIERATG